MFRDPEADKQRSYAKLKEDDILHLAKLFLPALNFALSKTKELFSGEPSMTLKVIHATLLLVNSMIMCKIMLICIVG